MNTDLPSELSILKETLRRFVNEKLIPIEAACNRSNEARTEALGRVAEEARALGLALFDVPEKFGGQGFGMLARTVVWSEMARTSALPARNLTLFGPNVSPLLYHVNKEVQDKYLFPVLRGEKKTCFAQTEADAGSDPGAMRTSAVLDGDVYRINGVKRYITAAREADFAQVFAVTDPAKGSHGGISAFVVDLHNPGISISQPDRLMIDDEPSEIVFNDVMVPIANRIGMEGEGFKFAQSWINGGRIRHGARAIGVIERCLEMGARYAKQRKTFGHFLSQRQTVQNILVDMYADLQQLRLMVFDTAARYDRGETVLSQAYLVKILGDERSFKAADRCMQLHGGAGLSKDLPIEKFFRDQRSMMITEGPIEVLQMALSKLVLQQYGD